MVAQETGVPESYFEPGTPHRELIDEQIIRLGLIELSTVNWLQEISISNQKGIPTYHELKLYGRSYFLSTGLAPSSINSYYSTLKQFMQACELSDESSTEPHLGSEFQSSLSELKIINGNPPVVARLRRWHGFQLFLIKDQSLPMKFADALSFLIGISEKNQTSIAGETGISIRSLKKWVSGRCQPSDLRKVRQLELALDTAPGVLTQRLFTSRLEHKPLFHIPEEWWPEGWDKRSNKYKRLAVIKQLSDSAFKSETYDFKRLFDKALATVENQFRKNNYNERLKLLINMPYHFKIQNWPNRLVSEWHILRKYKTDPDSFANEDRSSAWSSTTADIIQDKLEGFYGYLCLPCDSANLYQSGRNMRSCDLTMSWLSFSNVVKDYLDFRKSRSGKYNTGTVLFIETIVSLLRSGTGWIYQSPELKSNLPQKQQDSIDLLGGWEKHCDINREGLIKSLKILKSRNQIGYTREPFFPISPILDLESPLSPIMNALKFYARELQQTEKKNSKSVPAYAAKWRNLLLLSMLVRLPLRSKHWRIMSYREDNTGTLSRDSKGDWQLTLPFNDFKNHRNKKIFVDRNGEKAIVLSFNEQPLKPLVPLLELYLRDYWPTIVGGSERLFPSHSGKELTTMSLGDMVRAWTREYLSERSLRGCGIAGVLPFSIHAFRDILATHVIKTTGSIELAADLLLDSPEIVAKHYARFLPEDRLKRVFQELTIFGGDKS